MVTDDAARPADERKPADETPSRTQRRVRCPTCGAGTSWRDNPHRPFCSLTCRLIDLGGWLDERYRIAPREDDEDEGRAHGP
jgi:endogenous inhibitor of DNA gyrase (YacG/DUF329 family)